jgi:dipeptidyl aminopeptidase/acylaminoacyl peptidase
VLYRASHLADVDYLLIHGTGDGRSFMKNASLYYTCFSHPLSSDNVHFQHTAQLVEALTEANVLFDMQVS